MSNTCNDVRNNATETYNDKKILISQTPEELLHELFDAMELTGEEKHTANRTMKQIACMQATRKYFSRAQWYGRRFIRDVGPVYSLVNWNTTHVDVIMTIKVVYVGDYFQLVVNSITNKSKYLYYSDDPNERVYTPPEVIKGFLNTKDNINQNYIESHKYI